MASTYSDLKIELIATGEQSGTWGSTTNVNLGTAVQEAITGRAAADFTSDADLTLGYTDSNATQVFRNLILNVTSGFGSLTTTRNLIVPTIEKQYLVENNTTGGQAIVVKTSAGTGVTIPNGSKAHVYADGTNVVQAADFVSTLTANALNVDNINIDGNTISSTDTDGNIAITPDGTGEVDISKVDIDSGAIDGTTIGAASASTGVFTQVDVEAQGDLRLQDTTGGEYVALQAPTAVTSYTLTFPSALGTNGQILQIDGSGNLSFTDQASGGITTGKAIAMAIVFGG